MHITSIDTTPNPNSMKLNVDAQLGAAITYSIDMKVGCPDFVEKLLAIAGIQSVFVCQDFITVNKDPRADWKNILGTAASLVCQTDQDAPPIQTERQSAEKEGQVQVFVQIFRRVPIQIKVVDSEGETRVSLGARFNDAAQLIQAETGADYLKERYWADHGVRYGARSDVANEVAEEIHGAFDDITLERTQAEALGKAGASNISVDILKQWLNDEDWHRRLAAVQELSRAESSVSLIASALKDSSPQVRRVSAAALGATGSGTAVEPLCDALLSDPSPGVRRTCGDALSDIGDSRAQPAICQALSDSNKLVRWRAARFLSDLGTQEALPYLERAIDDPEFEVRLEIESAIQRIQQGGSEGLGPAWKRIVEQG